MGLGQSKGWGEISGLTNLWSISLISQTLIYKHFHTRERD